MLKLSRFWRNRNEEIAAIDLGSNSFHMIVARVADGQITIIDRMKESVRLGYGLDDEGNLDELSQKRALDCLERFSQRIKHLPAASVRAVGTRTLRMTNNVYQFLAKAEKALGFDIQIIAGAEEARLVYQGVAYGLEDDHQTRLVIDIGGGSTEVIIGEDFTPLSLESLGMGCVSISKRFFHHDIIDIASIRAADIYCQRKLEPIRSSFRRVEWQRVIGCSGSIKAISSVLEQINGHPTITPDGIEQVLALCLNAGKVNELKLPGLSTDRQPVFMGGLVVLRACMKALNLNTIEASPWALREGVLFDLLGHDSMSDMRERSVIELAKRFHTDTHHAQQCNDVAQKMLVQVSKHYTLDANWTRYLYWACLLQESGLDINHERFHIHSGYIVENSHLAGFGHDEQHRLTCLVRNQRKKPDWIQIERLPPEEHKEFSIILQVFRLACALTRARNDIQDIGWALSIVEDTISFNAPSAWWESQLLAAADLNAEVNYMKKSRFQLQLNQPETL